MVKKEPKLESVLDLNGSNVWGADAHEIAEMWENDKHDEDFRNSEDKILNIIRLSFEVVHYNDGDPREKAKYENGEWAIFTRVVAKHGCSHVAIRKKEIKRITDLSYENVKHISAALLLELIDRNFGGGWDSIQLSLKDIIESGFEISTTTLPTSRLHSPGGTYERKTQAGFDVLEVAKGNWTEAIFAKKKDPVEKIRLQTESRYDEDGNLIKKDFDDDDDLGDDPDLDKDDMNEDETYYSSYSGSASKRGDDEDDEYGGLTLEGGDEDVDEDDE
ncbi:MAG: hypothetical protein MJZ60_04645 [Bacteroidaceae bacterium]|nr:hypothetical protein [Bacteroidaceae bacterium]